MLKAIIIKTLELGVSVLELYVFNLIFLLDYSIDLILFY